MNNGIVKWFNERKGFGFIEQQNGEDLFVHKNEVKGGYLQEGDKVQFTISQSAKGLCATEVSVR